MLHVDELLECLEHVRRSGTGWVASCPAHDDRAPSLSITEGDDRLLLFCHAGCRTEDILTELGLSFIDIHSEIESQIVDTYDYTDAQGNLLYQVVRYEPKDFRVRRPDGNGGWIWNLRGVDRVLFRLPEILAAIAQKEPVYICEGEKDVLAVEAMGGVATTSGAAGTWRDHFADILRYPDVTVIAHKDEPGRKNARGIKASLGAAGATTVRVLEAAEGNDAWDHWMAGWQIDSLIESNLADISDEVCLDTIKPKSVIWHWKPFVQQSAFHLLAGRGGAGKGSWLALMTAAMTRGESEHLHGEPRNVIIVASEDSASVDLVPRIMAAGGILSRVFLLKHTLLLPRDVGLLERKITQQRNGFPTGAVIIDPIANHLGGADTNGEGVVREAINELNHVADRTECAIFGVRHMTKYGEGVTGILGSAAWTDSPRIALEMKQSVDVPFDVDDRCLEVVKSNRGRKGERREYRIERVNVEGVEDTIPKLVRSQGSILFGGYFPADQP